MNKFIKTAHVLFACLWMGGSCSVAVLHCLRGWSHDERALTDLNLDLGLLALTLVVPGALGSLLTGFVLCHTTRWHILRYRWIVVKWIGALSALLVLSVLLIPCQIRLVNLSGELVGAPVAGGQYDVLRAPFAVMAFLQVYLLMMMVAVAGLKPWGVRLPHRTRSMAVRPADQAAGVQRRRAAVQGRMASDQ